ncbi:MAG: hypothetical protein QNK37_23370 [Acidobacteriota bacterium]|nr:hypothetical protein [Acidobacteriota bacterium]
MLLGGVRLGIETALKRPERPDFDALVDEIWGFAASAMRIAPSDQEEKEDVA